MEHPRGSRRPWSAWPDVVADTWTCPALHRAGRTGRGPAAGGRARRPTAAATTAAAGAHRRAAGPGVLLLLPGEPGRPRGGRGRALRRSRPWTDDELPAIDGLYAGGGFPEVHAAELAANRPLREALARQIDQGLPVWAECGGLMYLSRALVTDGDRPRDGRRPAGGRRTDARPQGHGYVQARADRANPFLAEGTDLCGHEFHYSRLLRGRGRRCPTVLGLDARASGSAAAATACRSATRWPTYTHLHALATPAWADGSGQGRGRGACNEPPDAGPGPGGAGRDRRTGALVARGTARRPLPGGLHLPGRRTRSARWPAGPWAVAARHHPDLVQQVVRRLVWAMNDESGTNALTAPEVVKAVADESRSCCCRWSRT